MKVLVLNGPNLGRLGRREPEIYGHTSYDELVELCVDWGRELGVDVEVRQTNHEGALLDWLNEAADEGTPVVLNAGAWTHYSYALFDACAQLTAPLVEVHISDPAQRPEEFRHTSVVTPHARPWSSARASTVTGGAALAVVVSRLVASAPRTSTAEPLSVVRHRSHHDSGQSSPAH